jgi:predicted anti-sigma-YlaC factor YlaD
VIDDEDTAMNCDTVSTLLPDYWAGALDGETRALVDSHLSRCQPCQEMAGLWTQLGELPGEQPNPAMRARFETMLAAYQHGVEQGERRSPREPFSLIRWFESWWPARPAFQLGAAVACLVAGIVVGRAVWGTNEQTREMARLHEELQNTREMVAVSLLQQQSATDRLRGVSWSTEISQPDQTVLSALVTAAKYDTNVDVRLAAVDALRKYAQAPVVRRGLLEALNAEQSPLVQIALIEQLTEIRERGSISALKRLESDRSVNESVRQRAGWAVSQF